MKDATDVTIPSNDLSLARIHATMDRMPQAGTDVAAVTRKRRNIASDFPADVHDAETSCPKDPGVSDLVKEALAMTGRLWQRIPVEALAATAADTRHSSCPQECEQARARQAARKFQKKRREKKRRPCQVSAYHKWDEPNIREWWCAVRSSQEPPAEEQESFLK